MRFRHFVSLSTLAAFALTLSIGCGEGTDVKLANAPVPEKAPPKELPKELTKGGGPGSSGNMNRDPSKDPMER
jgi:hypothetical protein